MLRINNRPLSLMNTSKQRSNWFESYLRERENYNYSHFMKVIRRHLQETTTVLTGSLPVVAGGVQIGSTRHSGHLLSYCACPG
jgi:hypothetical protein